jgi:GH25 family lysozyme M1 (1,4-beta-N-acetylmuramidase)
MPKASDGKQVQAGDRFNPKNYVDDWLYRNVQKCFDAKIPCAPYHYVQPYLSADYTVQGTVDWNMQTLHAAFDPLTPKVSYHAIVLDVEEKTASPLNGSDVVLKMMEAIALDPKLSQVPLIIYSSMSVLNYYTKLREQISYPNANRNLWMAQWVYNTTTNTSWESFWTIYAPKIDMKVLTPGYANWKFVQVSASFILPGGSGRTDISFYNGTRDGLFSWLKFDAGTTPPEPPPPPPPSGDIAVRLAALESNDAAQDARLQALEGFRDNVKGA